MSQRYRIYFHLGLPKVASTYLQRDIFPNLQNAHFYKKHKFIKYKTIDSAQLEAHTIFSSEMDRGLEDTLDHILSLHPEARIILLIRSHEDWVLSRYKYHLRKFGSYSLEEFLDLDNNQGHWKTEELLFSKKIEYIHEECKHKPLILNYDLLKQDRASFLKLLTNYLGCNLEQGTSTSSVRNRSFNKKQLILLRRFNKSYPYIEKKTSSKILNKLHYRYRQYILHIMAFLFRFFPKSAANETLVNQDYLQRIKAFYAEDWKECLRYVPKPE